MKLATIAVSTSLPLLIIFIISDATPCAAFTPKDYYLLNSGDTSVYPSTFDNRFWQSDENSTFSSSFDTTKTATDPKQNHSVPQIPFWTARIFHTNFTYSFPVSPGPKFLRLYFYPATYSGLDPSQFLFSVNANNNLVLSNFSPYLSAIDAGESYLLKEYYINVLNGTHSLKLSFSPTSPSSLGFVNGIELVSLPDGLYVSTTGLKNVDSPNIPIMIAGFATMETVYRLNVGGSEVNFRADCNETGIYRVWKDKDETYMIGNIGITGDLFNDQEILYTQQTPNYTAPSEIYGSFRSMGTDWKANLNTNLTWRFPVDGGFTYLLRLHWCEVVVDVNNTNERVFSIYINNQTAEERADILAWSEGVQRTAVHRDYVVFVNNDGGSASASFIWLTMHPVTDQSTRYADVLLNGLEIFKLSLNSTYPVPVQLPSDEQVGQPPGKSSKKPSLAFIIGGVFGGILVVSLLLGCFIFRRQRVLTDQARHVRLRQR